MAPGRKKQLCLSVANLTLTVLSVTRKKTLETFAKQRSQVILGVQ